MPAEYKAKDSLCVLRLDLEVWIHRDACVSKAIPNLPIMKK